LSARSIRLLVPTFFALGLLLLLHHAMWQDEWQAWLIARDSGSLAQLLHHLRYEGHPALWYLPLYGLSRLTAQPLAMQLLHLTLATATVFVFLRFSPFTRLQKMLFIFGYFPFFEYAVISRNYAAGVLLIFTYCAVFPLTFRRKYLVLAGLLFLLCQTSIYGLMLALALGAAQIWAWLTDDRTNLSAAKYELVAFTALLLAGAALAVLQLLPPPDSGFAVDWRFYADWPAAVRTLNTIWGSYVPLPALQVHFWNTNLVSQSYLKLALSLLLLTISWLLLRRRPAALALYGLGTLALLSFTYAKYPGSLRHHGHLFLLLVAALWLADYYPGRPEKPGLIGKTAAGCRRHQGFITVMLSAQLLAGLTAAGWGLCYPFSAGRETARFIQDQGLSGMPLAGDQDDAASVISGYLGRPIYYLCANRWGSYVIWDNQRKDLELPEAQRRARELAGRCHQDVLLILNRKIEAPEPEIIPLRQFQRSTVPAESFYLYRVRARPAP
jgi:hypothetical protein